MKKIILAATLLAASLTTFAQDETIKPTSGENTLELQFAPLGGSPFSMGGIRYRKFTSETMAFRATVFIGYTNTSTLKQEEDGDADLIKLKDASSSFEIAIRPGVEFHLAGTSRLSPYYGAEIDIANKQTRDKTQTQNADKAVDKAVTRNADGFTRLGLNGIFGADYYLAPKVFIGAELGFGLAFTKDSKTVGVPAEGDKVESKVGNEGTFNLGPNVLAQFRLGIVF
jgi:hypothetical protein